MPGFESLETVEAGQNQRRNVSRTWVLHRSEEGEHLPEVLGYYTLTLGGVARESLPESTAKKLPRYPVPVVIIGRLAVDERARRLRIGERLLVDAQARALAVADQAGCVGIIVDAKDAGAVAFYEHYGYEVLDQVDVTTGREWPKRMFLPMSTIRLAHQG
jgi:GNAT superfamily N-acetyltransferase